MRLLLGLQVTTSTNILLAKAVETDGVDEAGAGDEVAIEGQELHGLNREVSRLVSAI